MHRPGCCRAGPPRAGHHTRVTGKLRVGTAPRRAGRTANPAGLSPPDGEHGEHCPPSPSYSGRSNGAQPPDRSPPAAPARRRQASTLPKLSPSAQAARRAAALGPPATPLSPVPPRNRSGRLRRALPGRSAAGPACAPTAPPTPAPDGQWTQLGLRALREATPPRWVTANGGAQQAAKGGAKRRQGGA